MAARLRGGIAAFFAKVLGVFRLTRSRALVSSSLVAPACLKRPATSQTTADDASPSSAGSEHARFPAQSYLKLKLALHPAIQQIPSFPLRRPVPTLLLVL